MRLQKVLQSRLDRVVGADIAGTLLVVVRGQIAGAPARRPVLVPAKSRDPAEDVQEVGHYRAARQADQVSQRRIFCGISARRCRLQELRRVFEAERVGRDLGGLPEVVTRVDADLSSSSLW